MKQFKAEWQDESDETSNTTLGHLIEKHNELCDYLEDYLKAQAEQAKEALLKLTE